MQVFEAYESAAFSKYLETSDANQTTFTKYKHIIFRKYLLLYSSEPFVFYAKRKTRIHKWYF
jgi:hypothetical protein